MTADEVAHIVSPAAKVKSPPMVIVCGVVVAVHACPLLIALAEAVPKEVECGSENVHEGVLESEVIKHLTFVIVTGTSKEYPGTVLWLSLAVGV